ncbi:PLC-like phosphodiesterase [Irpex lacteus]|nr:PLC-like phosphodiesterase [Irpex lacteus]
MGEDSTFTLINATAYDWHRTAQQSYQMDKWNFPETIPAGTTAKVEVEFDENVFHNKSHDGGEVFYSLSGTPATFQLQARAPKGKFKLQAYLDGLSTVNNPQGSTIDLGWNEDGVTPFILSGTVDKFASSNPPSDWMQKNLSSLGNRQLRQLCILGSHDSGMSVVTGRTGFADSGIVITQSRDIGQQLALGARYFDIRPVIAGGAFKTGHYSKIPVNPIGWQGADGQTIQDIIRQINEFTANNKELIILNFGHDLNTDVGRDYRPFNQDEYNRLFEILTGIENLYVVEGEDPTTVDLTTLPLNRFIGSGRAAVLAIIEPRSIQVGDYSRRGFYKYPQFNAYNSYANKNDLDDMINDQLDKMRKVRSSPDSQLFLLSWTLTQQVDNIVAAQSILRLANKAGPAIFGRLLQACSPQMYPNILYLDNLTTSDYTALAMAINDMSGL